MTVARPPRGHPSAPRAPRDRENACSANRFDDIRSAPGRAPPRVAPQLH